MRHFLKSTFGPAIIAALMTCGMARAETVDIVTYLDYPPFLQADLPEDGLYLDIVRQSFHLVGVDIRLQLMPWKRGLRAVESGRYPVNVAWTLNHGRGERFLHSKAIFSGRNYLFTSMPEIKTWHDIQPLADAGANIVICVPLGWGASAAIEALIEDGHMRVTEPEKLASCIEQIMVGRAQVIDVMRLNARYFLMSPPPVPEDMTVRPIYEIPGPESSDYAEYVLFSPTDTGRRIKKLFDEGFEKLVTSGQYEQILLHHLENYTDQDRRAVMDDLISGGVLPAK